MALKQGSMNLDPGSGKNDPQKNGSGKKRKKNRGRMSLQGKLVIAALGAVLLWAVLSLVFQWFIPNRQEKETLEQVRSMVGATAEPTQAVTQVPEATATAQPAPVITAAAVQETAVIEATPIPVSTRVPSVTMIPTTAAPEVLEEYKALYAKNSDMAGWLKVRAIRNIDFPFVRGKNEYYIGHDFYGRENAGGTAFLDETCTDWPRDRNLIIYAHNLKSGEMFGELNRLSNLTTLRTNPFVECSTLYEKGVYIPVSVFICSVDPADPVYFNFNLSTFRNQAEFDAYIARAKELNRVSINVDVNDQDDLLTLVTCRDENGLERFAVLLRKLRTGETESSAREMYFR